jgi:hypothetical protein
VAHLTAKLIVTLLSGLLAVRGKRVRLLDEQEEWKALERLSSGGVRERYP